MKRVFAIATVALVLLGMQSAQAISYGFSRISNNGVVDIAGQLSLEVMAAGSGQVSFTIKNAAGGIASTIGEIYVDGGLLGAPSIASSSGVSFVIGANPSKLPGGNNATPPFVTDVPLNSEASGNNGTGIDPGEWVKLTFGLGSFTDLNAVITAMDNGSLRFGLHVRSIAQPGGGDQSESYVTSVPESGLTVAFLGMGLFGLGALRRKLN